MNRCPRCGAEVPEGRPYCADPSCGAVLQGAAVPPPQRRIVIKKEIKLDLKLDFVTLARLAAAAIAALAAAWLYFFARS